MQVPKPGCDVSKELFEATNAVAKLEETDPGPFSSSGAARHAYYMPIRVIPPPPISNGEVRQSCRLLIVMEMSSLFSDALMLFRHSHQFMKIDFYKVFVVVYY